MSLHTDIDRGEVLLPIARAAIARRFGLWFDIAEDVDFLNQPGACFVTLVLSGRLRGCIGSLEARRALVDDVKANALAAAFQDPRFAPLSSSEFNLTQIEISLLSPLLPIEICNEEQAAAQLRPEVDGAVLEFNERRGTFLPQVWESLREPRVFLNELKRKAGLPADFWSDEVRLYRYQVEKWAERQ
ncbi:MAG: AmmeMemoRadiSam system protein A [Burkholderiales bacterium]